MSENQSFGEKYASLFQDLAELVNQQPMEHREQTRQLAGEFLHDLKHTLGLITGANALILRDLRGGEEKTQSFEMVKIANDAALKIDAYVDLVTETFVTNIDAEVPE